GVYHLLRDEVLVFAAGEETREQAVERIAGINNPELDRRFSEEMPELREQVELLRAASHPFSLEEFLQGQQTPVFFGSAINNFGVRELLGALIDWAPSPRPRPTTGRTVMPEEEAFSGFVFKIQANMDPQHRDRVAFLRICSGHFKRGMKIRQLRLGRDIQVHNPITFLAQERELVEEAFAGDIIGLHNHGSIQIGDSFSQGEALQFTGIPYFAPELFRRVRLRNPLKAKQLQKGLQQLAEEGATQVFKPLHGGDMILGAVGVLQFDVVAERLKTEYAVDAIFEAVTVQTARWIQCADPKMLAEFTRKHEEQLAEDAGNRLAYLAPSRVNLDLTMERWPQIVFHATREHAGS
ncbi:peptide chain release factor 3, partial [Acidithiobacillus ferridurans]